MVATAPHPHQENAAFDELARTEPQVAHRALLVVYPKSACSGSARLVLMDGAGRFHGAVGPGEASLLEVPEAASTLVAVSSVEIDAQPGTWHFSEVVAVPPAPAGLLIGARRVDGRRCGGNGQYPSVVSATKGELETTMGESQLRWMAPRLEAGQAWLDSHRERLTAILATR